jgi:hypothetical protein
MTMLKMVLVAGAVPSLSTLPVAAQKAAAKAAVTARKPDIGKFCSQVQPGDGRIKGCMKEHLPELSEPCKEALFQAWLKN